MLTIGSVVVDVVGTPRDVLLSEMSLPDCLESLFFATVHMALEWPDISLLPYIWHLNGQTFLCYLTYGTWMTRHFFDTLHMALEWPDISLLPYVWHLNGQIFLCYLTYGTWMARHFFATLHMALEWPDISVAVNTTRFCVLHPHDQCLYISVLGTLIVAVFTRGDRV